MGQAKKRRACPVVNREIAAAECGENRLSRYACPEECPFNPFAAANYSALLATEDSLDLASVKRLAREDPRASDAIFAAQRASDGHGWHAETVRRLFFTRDANGQTFAERWEQAGFPELRNDERVLIRGKMKMRMALLEVHRVLDAQRFEAVDLLAAAPAPMILVDRSMAARAVRFSTYLTWVYPLPHFWRMSGTGIGMSDLGPFSAREMLDACIAHLGGPAERAAQSGWLAENFERIDAALTATARERRREMLAALDATWSAATYQVHGAQAKARKMLRADSATLEEQASDAERAQGFTRAFVWCDDAPPGGLTPAQQMGGRPVLGRVLLGKKEWRVEAMGQERFARLRAAFEARMGVSVTFLRERRDNLGGQMAAREPASDRALVPPRLLERPSKFDLSSSRVPEPPPGMSPADYTAVLLAEHRRAWLDQALAALDGRTPREAARDPALRARLIELAKAQVRQLDQKNLQTGRTDDINGWIRELGLSELDVPPPPLRAPPAEEGDGNEPEDHENVAPSMPDLSRAPAPRLPPTPFTFEEAVRRLEDALRKFDRAADALKELDASGASALDDVSALIGEVLSEAEFNFLIPLILQSWFSLVPVGVRAPQLDYGAMEADFDALYEGLRQGGKIAKATFAGVRDRCGQPGLLDAAGTALVDAARHAPEGMRPRPEMIPVMIIALKALIDALDAALRRR